MGGLMMGGYGTNSGKVLSTVMFYCQYTRVLTCENLCQAPCSLCSFMEPSLFPRSWGSGFRV